MKYFAYGSNLLSERLRRRTPSASNPIQAELREFEFAFEKISKDGSAKANVRTSNSGHTVHGVLWELDEAELPALDRAEGAGYGYHRVTISVSVAGQSVAAVCYIADDSFVDASLPPYQWYKDLVLAGAREHGLPETHIAAIEATRAEHDPNETRRKKNQKILAGE